MALAFELRGVRKAFGAQRVLDGVDLEVPTGSVTALLGRSGSGKSVLVHLLAGLLRPDAGEVRVDGLDPSTLGPRALLELHARLGVMFQGGALLDSIDVFENVAFPLREVAHLHGAEVEKRVMAALEAVSLTQAAHRACGALSGGMRKRVAFARATVLNPRLLLLDDPTEGLDPITTQQVAQSIMARARQLNATTLLVTHDLATAFTVADQVALLDEGKIVARGTPAQMLESSDPRVVRYTQTYRERLDEGRDDGSAGGPAARG